MSVRIIMKLLRLIFKFTYCEYEDKHYILSCDLMGLSVVVEITIIYMERLLMKMKTDEYPELREWPWYVDDSVLKCKQNRAEAILNHLNDQEHKIKFTKEEKKGNKNAVLDLELNVNRKKKNIKFGVHYKKTNMQTDRGHCVIRNTCKRKWRTSKKFSSKTDTREPKFREQ